MVQLLPVTVWETEYRVISWPAISHHPGFLAVTAAENQTNVTITLPIDSRRGSDIDPIQANVPTSFNLAAGDVLQILTPEPPKDETRDLTGGLVTADRPVQVIGGHGCTFVPLDQPACDHLEETMLSISGRPRPATGGNQVNTTPIRFHLCRTMFVTLPTRRIAAVGGAT